MNETAYDRLVQAALRLASGYSANERIASDPTFVCERGEFAGEARALMLADDLELYRAALAAFEAEQAVVYANEAK